MSTKTVLNQLKSASMSRDSVDNEGEDQYKSKLECLNEKSIAVEIVRNDSDDTSDEENVCVCPAVDEGD